MMNRQESNHIADAIESVIRPLAEWTVNRHVETDPSLPDEYGETWRGDWVGHVESNLRFLIQAVALDRPEIFANAMRWTAQAHCEHHQGRSHLADNLKCLRGIAGEELPPPTHAAINRCIDAGLAAIESQGPDEVDALRADDPSNRRALEFIHAILADDERGAASMIETALNGGMTVPDVYDAILQPAMREVGSLWHRGELTIAEEHLATAATRDIIARLRSNFAPPEADAPRAVAATVTGDLHDLGLRMAADLLEFDGWRVWFLGANVPPEVLIEFLKHSAADLLLLSVSTSLHLRTAANTIAAIRNDFLGTRLKVLVGGKPFDDVPDLWRDIGADAWGLRLREIPTTARGSLGNPR